MHGSNAGIHRRTKFTITEALKRRFWSRVNKGRESECWNWTGSMRNNYGAIKHERKVLSAHRVAFILTNGEPADGLVVGHKCDNRACCNPSHLEAITPGQNNTDARGRRQFHMNRGEDVPNAVLTEKIVKQLRKRWKNGETIHSIANEIGVHKSTVSKAVRRKTWKHVA